MRRKQEQYFWFHLLLTVATALVVAWVFQR